MESVTTGSGVDYAARKLHGLELIRRNFGITALLPQLQACRQLINGAAMVDVAVVGRFKSGKSSFLNHALGRDVLPVGVLPLTAVVTRLVYGPRDRATIHHLDGSTREIPLGELADYVAEQRNPGNIKQVSIIDVELSNLAGYEGVRFVDTPGLGSIYAHNTFTSKQWLPQVGMALLTVSVDHPFGEDDAALLKELATFTPKIAVLLTKADLATADELAQIEHFVSQQAQKRLGEPVPVLTYSVRPGNEARCGAVEQLLHEVAEAQHRLVREIIDHKLRSATAACRDYLNLALHSATADHQARMQLHEQLQREQSQIKVVENEIRVVIQALRQRIRADAEEKFVRHAPDLSAALTADLEPRISTWRGNLRRETNQFDAWAAQALPAHLRGKSILEGEALINRHLPAVQASIDRFVHAFSDRLAKSIEQALHIPFQGATFEFSVAHPSRPDIHITRVFDTPVDELLWWLIPMFLVRRWVHRHMLRKLPWEAEKNLRRLAEQWTQVIDQSIDVLVRQALDFIRQELDTLQNLLANAEDQRPRIERALASLDLSEHPTATSHNEEQHHAL